jgi:hypothetical protein
VCTATDFLRLERERGGWRFWLLWVLATNAGFFPGLWLGTRLAELAGGPPEPVSGVIVGACFALLVGAAQSWVLARHVSERGAWALATVVGWSAGVWLAGSLLLALVPDLDTTGAVWVLAIGFLAGAAVGVPQWWVLRRAAGVGAWWIPVSAVGWGIFFPGMVTGYALSRVLRR